MWRTDSTTKFRLGIFWGAEVWRTDPTTNFSVRIFFTRIWCCDGQTQQQNFVSESFLGAEVWRTDLTTKYFIRIFSSRIWRCDGQTQQQNFVLEPFLGAMVWRTDLTTKFCLGIFFRRQGCWTDPTTNLRGKKLFGYRGPIPGSDNQIIFPSLLDGSTRGPKSHPTLTESPTNRVIIFISAKITTRFFNHHSSNSVASHHLFKTKHGSNWKSSTRFWAKKTPPGHFYISFRSKGRD